MRLDLERHGTRHANMEFFTKRRREFDLFITVSFKLSIGIHFGMCMPKELGCNRLSFPILFRSNLMQTKHCFCLMFTFHIHSNLFLAFDYTKCLIVTRTGFFSNICSYHSFCLLSAFFGYFANAKQQRNDSFF